MKQLAWLLLVVGLTVQAAGLGQLFDGLRKPAPTQPAPQPPAPQPPKPPTQPVKK